MTWDQFILEVSNAALPVLSTVLTALFVWLGSHAVSWLKAHTGSVLSESAQAQLARVADDVVRSLDQTMVANLKTSGQFTDEAQRQVKQAAVQQVLGILTPAALKFLTSQFGVQGDVGPVVNNAVEAAVQKLRHPPCK